MGRQTIITRMFAGVLLVSLTVAFCHGTGLPPNDFRHWGCDYEKPCVWAYNLVFPMGPKDNFLWESIPVNVAPCDQGCGPMRMQSLIVGCKGFVKKCKDTKKDDKTVTCNKKWCVCEYNFIAWAVGIAEDKDPKKAPRKLYFSIFFHNPPYEFGCRPDDLYNPCDCKEVLSLDSNHCYLDAFTCMPEEDF